MQEQLANVKDPLAGGGVNVSLTTYNDCLATMMSSNASIGVQHLKLLTELHLCVMVSKACSFISIARVYAIS